MLTIPLFLAPPEVCGAGSARAARPARSCAASVGFCSQKRVARAERCTSSFATASVAFTFFPLLLFDIFSAYRSGFRI